jgi:hypothetical protein
VGGRKVGDIEVVNISGCVDISFGLCIEITSYSAVFEFLLARKETLIIKPKGVNLFESCIRDFRILLNFQGLFRVGFYESPKSLGTPDESPSTGGMLMFAHVLSVKDDAFLMKSRFAFQDHSDQPHYSFTFGEDVVLNLVSDKVHLRIVWKKGGVRILKEGGCFHKRLSGSLGVESEMRLLSGFVKQGKYFEDLHRKFSDEGDLVMKILGLASTDVHVFFGSDWEGLESADVEVVNFFNLAAAVKKDSHGLRCVMLGFGGIVFDLHDVREPHDYVFFLI